MENKKINLAIVDDHQIVLNGIRDSIKQNDDIVLTASFLNGNDLLDKIDSYTIDVIIMDINMPDIDGMELCKKVKKAHPEKKIIGLTTFSQPSFISEMLRNGADGYLFKNTSEQELTKAIRIVAQGQKYLSDEVNQKLISKALSNSKNERSFIPKLTRRENEVLQLIIEENTNQEIADKLYLSVSTIETHRMNLCAKLDVRNTAGLVKKAIKFGLC